MPPWNSNILPHLNRRSPLIWRNILHHSYHIMLLFLLALIPRTFFPWKSWNLYGTSRTYTAYARQKNCKLKKSQNIRSIKILRNKPKRELLKTPFFFIFLFHLHFGKLLYFSQKVNPNLPCHLFVFGMLRVPLIYFKSKEWHFYAGKDCPFLRIKI